MATIVNLIATLSPAELVAFRSLLGGDKVKDAVREAKKSLGPGEHPVNASLRLTGHVKIGKDVDFTPTSSIPWKGILVLFMARMSPIERAGLMAVLAELANESRKADGKRSEEQVEILSKYAPNYAEVEAELKAALSEKLPKTTRAGNAYLKVEPTVVHHKKGLA